MLALLTKAIIDAGYTPAATLWRSLWTRWRVNFTATGRYEVGGESLSSEEMIERYSLTAREFPVYLIEDGLGEKRHRRLAEDDCGAR